MATGASCGAHGRGVSASHRNGDRPHAPEIAVLGGMLIDRDAYGSAADSLQATDFSLPAHRLIFQTAGDVVADGGTADVIALGDRLQRTDRLERAGGYDYLAELLDAVPTAANIEHHARIVREQAERRRLASLGRRIAREAEGRRGRNRSHREPCGGALGCCDLEPQW